MADTTFSLFNLADALDSYERDELEMDSCVHCHPKGKLCDDEEECELHSGIHLEVSEEPHSLRQVVNLVIALQRMKTKQQAQSTEFTDDELCSILLENLVEEYVKPRVHEQTYEAPERYTHNGAKRKCVLCDEYQKSLVLSSGVTKELRAITIQGSNMNLRVKLDLCSYTPSVPRDQGVPVVLGVPGNLYLSCTSVSGTPVLGLEMMNKETLEDISGDMKRFLFFKTSTEQGLSSFKSAKFEDYFISTSYENRRRVDVCRSQDAPNRLTSFNIIDSGSRSPRPLHKHTGSSSSSSSQYQFGRIMADTCFNLADALDSCYRPDDVEIDSCMYCHQVVKLCDDEEECELHSGIHLEVSEEPHSLRQVVNLVIALQRMKTKQQAQSTEFTDDELCSILLDNLVEEYVTPRIQVRTHQAPEHYTHTGTDKKCFLCDEHQKSLVLSSGVTNELQAITLQGANMSLRVKLDLCSYTPSVPRDQGVPVVLGVPGNLYLSCTSVSGTPVLGLEVITKETLEDISGDMKRFLFYKSSTEQALSSFESAKFEGYFISTSHENRQRVDVCQSQDASNRLTSFRIIDA
ncbi:interleukin-1 beta [Engraulis encrasicolus]|uniref:interleukin-1 beta n=1 Tax=Engraulis encrasicolus TaxID=184585 RepID=UPI002FD4F398